MSERAALTPGMPAAIVMENGDCEKTVAEADMPAIRNTAARRAAGFTWDGWLPGHDQPPSPLPAPGSCTGPDGGYIRA